MYIRRKVFSVALDESGEERYFSTNEIMSEDAYLEELMFAEAEEEEKKSHRGRNIAIGAGGAAALTSGGIYGAKKLGQHLSKSKTIMEKGRRLVSRVPRVDIRNRRQKVGDILQKPADYIVKATKGSKQFIVDKATGAGKWVSKHSLPVSIAAGTALAGGIGVYGYKKAKNKKNKGEVE